MQKIISIFSNRLPTEKAHGMQIAKMCEVFGEFDEAELWIPDMQNAIKESVHDYYNLKDNFKVKKIFCINLPQILFSERTVFRFRYLIFLLSLIFVRKSDNSVFLTRHPEVVFLLTLFGYKVFFENHNWYKGENTIKRNLFLLKKSSGIIVTTKTIREEFLNHGFKNILVAPNSVDLSKFDIRASKEEVRKKIGLSQNKKIILYAGHLYAKKGIYTLVDAAKKLSKEYEVIVVGGTFDDIRKLKNYSDSIENVKVLGHKRHSEVPMYLRSADMLVIANSAKYNSESKYTCPLKLFEYLASSRVIIASDVPSLREFVDDDSVVFFNPDDSKSLAQAILNVDGDKERQEKLIKNIKQKCQNFTWQKRGRDIVDFINVL